MSGIKHINEAQFGTEVVESSLPIVVDFYATWCPPCKLLAPILDRLAKEFEDRVQFVKVNVDEEPGLAAQHGISGVPTMKIYSGGRVRDTIVGLVPERVLASKLETLESEAPRTVLR